MKGQTKLAVMCALTVLGSFLSSASVSGPIFEERGTLMVGALVQQGMLVGDAAPTNEFDNGIGYGGRFRYYLGSSRALGLSFENQTFDAKPTAPDAEDPPKEFRTALMTIDYLWYFDRKSTLPRYVTLGLGVHHPVREYKRDSAPGSDGLAVSMGAGMEYFFHRSMAFDVSVRGYGLMGQGGFLGSVELAAGMNFYIIE